jgi:hypothetical protein
MVTTDDALRVKSCADVMLRVLGNYFPEEPDMAYTALVFLLVRITNNLGLDPDQVVSGLKQGFETQKLLEADVGNEWLN